MIAPRCFGDNNFWCVQNYMVPATAFNVSQLQILNQCTNDPVFFGDKSAPRSVFGRRHLMDIYRKRLPNLTKPTGIFRFGCKSVKLIRYVYLYVESPPQVPQIWACSNVQSVDAPELLWLDNFDVTLLSVNTIVIILVKQILVPVIQINLTNVLDYWSVQMIRINNHVYARMKTH